MQRCRSSRNSLQSMFRNHRMPAACTGGEHVRVELLRNVPTCVTRKLFAGQGAFLGAVMGQMTKLDPSITNQLLNQPNASPGMPGCPAWRRLQSLPLDGFATRQLSTQVVLNK